jgi:arylsulfatase
MRGNRAICHEGWKAVTIHKNRTDYEEDKWELYHVEQDFSEAIDVSEKHPEKLQELKDLCRSNSEEGGFGHANVTRFRTP